MKVGIVGYGLIGKEVRKKALERGWEVPVVLKSSGVYKVEDIVQRKIKGLEFWREEFERSNIDVGVIAIPTLDDGEIAWNYIKTLVSVLGKPVATSEKGALSSYFPDLKPYIGQSMIGYSATVGGGTRILHWLKERITPGTREIHLVINGTINYILDGSERGRAFDEVVDEARRLGYAEPGKQGTLETINAEVCRDIPMKTSIVVNICGLGEIQPREIYVCPLTEQDLRRLKREVSLRRYIVSITKEEDEEDIIGGFRFKLDDWWVSRGFKNRTQNPLFFQLAPPGVNNAALVHGSDGTYILTGPGAGAVPTASSLIKDIETLTTVRF